MKYNLEKNIGTSFMYSVKPESSNVMRHFFFFSNFEDIEGKPAAELKLTLKFWS